ncbi:MAG: ATP-binding cassette domain-containing protein, partial [Neisseriaceae bacterium]|nr:ATP-binding cassette domain-containing protein [Neisseriaceae bacterium]
GLFDSANKKPAELSGGMAARVALARALVRNPDIVFLDEPFAALDAITRHDMQRLLLQMAKTHHTAAVMVTHDIDEALLLADRIVLLGQSRLIDEWQLNQHFRRQSDDLGYQTIRKEILNALQNAQENKQQTDTVEFVI